MNDEVKNNEYQQEAFTHSEAPNDTPGVLLKKTREQHGFSVDEVATYLHLSRNVIESIEDDDYTKLPALTFGKGYLRAYAKLLKLDGDDIIARLSLLNITEPERAPVQKVIVKEIKAGDKPIKWISYIIVLALGSLVILWWHNHSTNSDNLTKKVVAKPTDIIQSNETVASESQSTNQEALSQPDVNISEVKPVLEQPQEQNNTQPSNDLGQAKIASEATTTKKVVKEKPQKKTVKPVTSLSSDNMDDISTHHTTVAAEHTAQNVYEEKKHFSGWSNPDNE